MIKSLVRDFIKGFGVQVMLGNEQQSGPLSFHILDFITRDGQYVSYFYVFNETEFFTFGEDRKNCIGVSQNDLQDKLWRGARIFDSKEEWLKGKYTSAFARMTVNAIKEMMTTGVDFSLQYEGFSVHSVTMFLTSVMGLNMIIAFEGTPVVQLHLYNGCRTVVKHPQIFEYMKLLGLERFIILEEDKDDSDIGF